MTLNLDFKVTVIFRPIDALNVLCAQLTRDLFAIAKFLFIVVMRSRPLFLCILRTTNLSFDLIWCDLITMQKRRRLLQKRQ